MRLAYYMFALVQPSSRLPPATEKGPFMGPMARDIIMIGLAALLVGLIAILWAVYLRRQPRQDRRSPTIISDDSGIPFRRGTQRRRRKRKESLSRKPTLAETGGLPPIKDKRPPFEDV